MTAPRSMLSPLSFTLSLNIDRLINASKYQRMLVSLAIARKLPLNPDTQNVELSGIFAARRFHEEIQVQRGADRLDSQTG